MHVCRFLLLAISATSARAFQGASHPLLEHARTGRRCATAARPSILALRAALLPDEPGCPAPHRRRVVGGAAVASIATLVGGNVPAATAMDFPANLFDLGSDVQQNEQGLPLKGDESIMKKKKHGTSDRPVMKSLRFGCDAKLADQICNYNRHFAEYAGYFSTTAWLDEVDKTKETTYYDSVTGKPLFIAPRGRTFDQFLKESKVHGWPSFRDEEVVWENVRCLKDGETVSLTGTHLGHNLPDRSGNRYCINLVSIAGQPTPSVAFGPTGVKPKVSALGLGDPRQMLAYGRRPKPKPKPQANASQMLAYGRRPKPKPKPNAMA